MTAAAASEHGLRRRVAQEACACRTRADRVRIWPSSLADGRSMAAARVSHIGICGAGARLEVLCELSRSSPHRGGASVASRGRDSADALPRAVPVKPSRARATPTKVRCHTARTACAPARRAPHAPTQSTLARARASAVRRARALPALVAAGALGGGHVRASRAASAMRQKLATDRRGLGCRAFGAATDAGSRFASGWCTSRAAA